MGRVVVLFGSLFSLCLLPHSVLISGDPCEGSHAEFFCVEARTESGNERPLLTSCRLASVDIGETDD